MRIKKQDHPTGENRKARDASDLALAFKLDWIQSKLAETRLTPSVGQPLSHQ